MKKIQPFFYLLSGAVLIGLSHMTMNIEILAWIASAPLLIYLSKTRGIKSRLWFFLALTLGWCLSVSKIITDPFPWFLIPAYSIPIALIQAPAYLVWNKWRNKKFSLLIFPSLMVIGEWLQYSFTPFGSWGAWALTQVDNLLIIQITSLFGLAGLGFLIHWFNVTIANSWINMKVIKKQILPIILVLAFTLCYGSLRHDLYNAKTKDTLKVSTVGTDSEINGLPMPSKSERDETASALFSRTYAASNQGAKLIVWNEAALVIDQNEELSLQDSLKQLALKCESSIVAGYIVILSEEPFRYENKYLFLTTNGEITTTYNKHHPVPGEPAAKGEEPFETNVVSKSTISGAICYDYDFPKLARAIGKKSVDIVALPSSDWKGIDPIHSKMAAIRAIEQGHSIVRSTRFGLSALINPIGELLAQQSSFDKHDKIMIGNIPEKRIKTVYSIIGDLFIYLIIGFIILFFIGNCNFRLMKKREE